ncbi:MAG: hypothetical protein IPL32_03745 [Chloracidobacterium sp.]|nr:hypothetical protein [Chloracidobacterium sp.]
MDDSDDKQEVEWPNDDEANDITLAYAAADDSHGSGSGCAGVVLTLTVTVLALAKLLF